jgi:hypothetical protein
MIWQDLLIDCWVDAEALLTASASAFGVPVTSVAVVDTPEQLLLVPDSALIILERTREYREFPLQLMVVLRDDALEARHAGFDGVLSVARTLARALNASVVFGDGPIGPYESVRVRPTGELDVVSLDSDDGDEIDSYFVFSSRPFDESRLTEAAARRQVG